MKMYLCLQCLIVLFKEMFEILQEYLWMKDHDLQTIKDGGADIRDFDKFHSLCSSLYAAVDIRRMLLAFL